MRVTFLLFLAALVQAQTPEATAGKKLFATYCSVGYCHGAEGRAGRGPRLRDREWDRAYLFKAIDQGIPNSSMPAWHGKLSHDQERLIIAYIFTIAKEISQPGVAAETPMPQPAEAMPAPTGKGVHGNSAAGKELFFDATNDRNCGVCHKAAGAGGDAGPDLGKLASQPAREILKRILLPSEGMLIEIVMKDGESLRGILAQENASIVRVYDLTSPGPPVLRTLKPAEISSRQALEGGIAHNHIAATYTVQQLLDIVTYLQSSGNVTLGDLF